MAEGMVLDISLGAVTPPGTTVAYGTSVEIMALQLSHLMEQTATLVGWNTVKTREIGVFQFKGRVQVGPTKLSIALGAEWGHRGR